MSYTRLDTDVCATNVSSSVDKRIPLPSPVYASVCDRFKSTSACFEVLFIARCASPRHRETPFPNPRLRYAASFAGAGRLPWQVWNRLGVVEKKLQNLRGGGIDILDQIFFGEEMISFFFLSLKQRRFGQRGFVQPLSNFVFPIGSLIILIQL